MVPQSPLPLERVPRQPRRSRQANRVLDLHSVRARRLIAVYLILAAGLGGLAVRLAWLQLVDGGNLETRARSIQTHAIAPIGERRTIVEIGRAHV